MKPTLILMAMILFFTSVASATVVNSWDAPNEIWGLTSDGTYLWAGQDDDPSGIAQLLKLNPDDGSIIEQFAMPGQELRGIGWDGTTLWVYSYRTGTTNIDSIFQVDPADGTILASLQTPFTSNNYVGGMTFFDGYLWITRYYPDDPTEIHKVDPSTGASVATITSPHPQPEGITHDATTLWMVGDYFGGAESILYQLNPTTGEVLHQEYPLGEGVVDTRTYDLTYDGNHFFLVTKRDNNYALRSVYELQIGEEGDPVIEVTGTPIDFGEVTLGNSTEAICTVTNSGTANLVFMASTTSPFVVEAGPYTVIPGVDIPLAIEFSPESAGEFSETVTLASNDPVTPEVTFTVTGTGIEPPTPEVEFDPEAIVVGWGLIPTFWDEVYGVQVDNVGDTPATLVVDSLVFEGELLSEDYYTPDLPETLMPNENGWLTFDLEDGFYDWIEENDLWMSQIAGTLYLSFEENPQAQVQLPCTGGYVNVNEQGVASPLTYQLADPYPNPFNTGLRIEYALPRAGDVTIQVVDVLGRHVRTLQQLHRAAGSHEVFWNGLNDGLQPVSSGTYFIQMNAGEFNAVKRVQFMK
ncbi:choice-of-anchor D domain-containing protein [bacterium]|nr:choice-of-anchor D domain-containing protein [bacterium]